MNYKFLLILLLSTTIFGQEILEEELVLYNNQIELPGTLTYRKNSESASLAIFIHGSGNIDRNGNQPGVNSNANYIKLLSDSLVKNNIAFYRYDKRTSNKKNLALCINDMTFNYLADDVRLALRYFRKDDRFKNIVLIGHSQGALVGLLCANNLADKYISLAGSSENFEDIVVRQITAQNKDLGSITSQHFKSLKEKDTIINTNPLLASIFNPINYDFIKSYINVDPIEKIKEITIPTLIVNGDADLQVRILDAKLLQKAKPDAKLAIIPKMNHVLKHVNTLQENQQSYYSKEYNISPELITVVVDFIKS